MEGGGKKEIHEYWDLSTPLFALLVHHTLDLPLLRDPQQMRSPQKTPIDLESKKTPERQSEFKKPKEWRLLLSRPNELFSWMELSCPRHASARLNDDVENSFQKTRDGGGRRRERASTGEARKRYYYFTLPLPSLLPLILIQIMALHSS